MQRIEDLIEDVKWSFKRAQRERAVSKAEAEMPESVGSLLDSVRSRYAGVDLSSGRFDGLSEREKLRLMIEEINNDQEIHKYVETTGRGNLVSSLVGEHTGFGGFGTELIFRKGKLNIYEWNDYPNQAKSELTPADPDTVAAHWPGGLEDLNASRLKDAVVKKSKRRNYAEHVVDFK